VADSCISVAVVLFVIHSFWKHERRAGTRVGAIDPNRLATDRHYA
jgi:hypothetical protein